MQAIVRSRARFGGQHVLAAVARPKASPAWVAVRALKIFDKIIPEDDPEMKKQKELERAIIKKKMQRSKIAEMLSAHKDKKFVAGETLEPVLGATMFPDCIVRDLVSDEVFDPASHFRKHGATLVTVGFQAIGQKQLEAWLEAFSTNFKPDGVLELDSRDRPALLNVVYLEGWFFKLLSKLFTSTVRGGVPPAVVQQSVVVFSTSEKETDHFVERLGIHNQVLGYLYLVDSAGNIRWRAHGDPAPGELDSLMTATKSLLGRPSADSRKQGNGG